MALSARMIVAAFWSVAIFAGAPPAPSAAGTVEVRGGDRAPDSEAAAVLTYTDEVGGTNDLHVSAEASVFYDPPVFLVRDTAGVTPGKGCERVGGDPRLARCSITRTDYGTRAALDVRLRRGNDSVTLADGMLLLSIALHGGPGADDLRGAGDSSNLFVGGPGDDRMTGGVRGDIFLEGSRANGSDAMRGRGLSDPVSEDYVIYSERREGVRADLTGDRDDGAPGERDRVGSDIEVLVGGRGDDRLAGGDRDDFLIGGPGADALFGGAGDDDLAATSVSEWFPGPGTFKEAREVTADLLSGGPGRDRLSGSAGADLLIGGAEGDEIFAGRGRDRVRALDGDIDSIDCAGGNDGIRQDRLDFHSRCERTARTFDAAVPFELSATVEGSSYYGTYAGAYIFAGCPGRQRHCGGLVQVEQEGRLIGQGRFGALARAGPQAAQFAIDAQDVDLLNAHDASVTVTVRSRGRGGALRSVRVQASRIGTSHGLRVTGFPWLPVLPDPF
jgi:hypothetical protein